jgi:hypothetical protein
MQDFRIAFIITAYKNPSQLVRLLKRLESESVDIYLHIDRKVDILPFQEALKASKLPWMIILLWQKQMRFLRGNSMKVLMPWFWIGSTQNYLQSCRKL